MREQRRYVRMNTVFPVEFEILGDGKDRPSGLLQGFTRDVSEGGMCIEFKLFSRTHEETLQSAGLRLRLMINPTFSVHPIRAVAAVVWVQKEISADHSRYLIGIQYEDIEDRLRRRIIRHAQRAQWAPRLAAAGALVLVAALMLLWVQGQSLVRENRRLIASLQTGAERRSQVARDLEGLDDKKKALTGELAQAQAKIKAMQTALETVRRENESLNEQNVELRSEYMKQMEGYEAQLAARVAEEGKIRSELEGIGAGQRTLRETYQRLEEADRGQSEAVLEGMVEWLHTHQNHRTGLVASFEGDPSLEDTGFTYDQALAAQVFLLFDDPRSADEVLSFFDKRAARVHGIYFNAYDVSGGGALENIVHVGPNVWIGIAALQYESKMRDGRYLPMAQRIAEWLIRLQDAEGGLKGGPDVTWYSTEHNLDAYAYFGMMHQITRDARYLEAQRRVLEWIKRYAYSNESRLNRGKGDATIATDTFGWSIAAIGPETLASIQFDPEGIVEFAETHCLVTVDFKEQDGKSVKVQGFDFAKAQNLGRGGVISAEWTAQMVVGYQVMARYFRRMGEAEKAQAYAQKSDRFLSELQKMLITSPSRTGQGRGCLPYASMDNVDTGHGWRTPKGSSTGSVAATSYGIFAWKGYNPFELDGGEDLNAAS